MSYAPADAGSSIASKFSVGSGECDKAMKEVNYVVRTEVKDSPKGFGMGKKNYVIKSIKATVILYKNAITSVDNKKAAVNQHFHIKFLSSSVPNN
jgi:hypothetical protein